jgi:hypothetical protein
VDGNAAHVDRSRCLLHPACTTNPTQLSHDIRFIAVYFDYDKAAMEKHKWLANPFARGTVIAPFSPPWGGHEVVEAARVQDKPIGSYADTQPMVYRISQPRDARTYVRA